ncbi:M56 family metallopeptidase [Flavobacterium sp. TMP13]|uniref:M56 family metallopeptidase n=1 Tax=Flavobacterium sp. TMP13 TaxID=3425950 RepID=UPI003D77C512
MIDFLIKSTIALAVLLAVYYLLLEKEKMHQFNRFYLLFALTFSLVLPFITIEVIPKVALPILAKNTILMQGQSMQIIKDAPNFWLIMIWSLYGLITSILSFRFIRNSMQLQAKTKSNTAIAYKTAKLVLVQEDTLPYTFLSTIFINELNYRNSEIEAELYTHELIHVTQKHSLDILLIEALKVIFWFNPLFVFYKKAIQLNHEFLADEKVVTSHNDVPFYQNLLLAKANANPTYYLASNLNFSVTKKRLLMMTKTTSKTNSWIKKSIVFPVLTGLVCLLCTKTVAQVPKETNAEIKKSVTKEETNEVYNTSGISESPTFPGGIADFYKFVGQNFQIPQAQAGTVLKGKVYVTFIVEKDGSLSDYNILRDIGHGTGEEVIRVLKLCPKWNPGKKEGLPVRTMFSLPITIAPN